METEFKDLQNKIDDFIRSITDDLMKQESITDLKTLQKDRTILFHKLIKFLSYTNKEIKNLESKNDKSLKVIEKLKQERERLKVLYSSGIMISSEIEKDKLLKLALNLVVKEIKADNGFIVLNDRNGNSSEIISHQIEVDADENTKNICMSVISSTLNNLTEVNTTSNDYDEDGFIRKSSSVGFGLKDVLCIPLLSNISLLGVLYIDRKKSGEKFSETDLAFIISFSKQIVRGLIISSEISSLRDSVNNTTRQKLIDLRSSFKSEEIVGNSKKLYESLKYASKIAKSNINVFLLGENGTGKDLFAHAIHNNSLRADYPFVSINCGAIPSDLLESELFGYEAGAYTGAVKSKPGILETANGGTVFLDEITEMPLNLQTKLLKVIQEKEIQRLGSIKTNKIDVRFISATNRDINEYIKSNNFRLDLYYRLKVIEIKLPSLVERKEDIEELAEFFLNKYSPDNNFTIPSEVISALEDYNWPGNIRELENIIQRSIALSTGPVILLDDLPPEIITTFEEPKHGDGIKTLSEAEKDFRKKFIRQVLRETKSKSEAAEILGINRTHLHKLLSQLDIN